MKMRKLDEKYKDPKERITLTEAEVKEKKFVIKKLYGEIEALKEEVEPLRWELHDLNNRRDIDPWHLVGTDRIIEALIAAIDKEFDIRALQTQITGLKWDLAANAPKPDTTQEPACSTI